MDDSGILREGQVVLVMNEREVIPMNESLFADLSSGETEPEPVEQRRPEDWQEGELYICRQGKLEHIERDPSDMRRVRITEEAYQVAMELGKRLRPALAGYKPDVALVISALVVAAGRDADTARAAVQAYVLQLFSQLADTQTP